MATKLHLRDITALNTRDFARAFKLERYPLLNRVLMKAMHRPAKAISQLVVNYDQCVGSSGLQHGSQWVLQHFTDHLYVEGAQAIPKSGPLLIVSNHPGMADAVALFAVIERPDLRVIAAERPILRLVDHISRLLFFVPDDAQKRLAVIRQITGYLREGGALLTFPSGKIEPDPKIRPSDALTRLDDWSDSISLLARLVPELVILPAAASGVISPRTLNSPVVRLYQKPEDREWLAATLQLILPAYRKTMIEVRFGQPIYARDTDNIAVQVRQQMQDLIRQSF